MELKFPSRELNSVLNKLTENFKKLSSGKRINSAKDDAAGLAILNALESDVKVLDQGTRNTRDAQSAIAIAEGATGQISSLLTRQSELAEQAANGSLSDEQRGSLQAEFEQLGQEIDRIANTTEFNGKKLLNGDGFSVQVGADGSSSSSLQVDGVQINSVQSLSIGSIDDAKAALDQIKTEIGDLSSKRANLGSASSRLDAAAANNSERSINERDAASRIGDVDVAEETAALVANKIRAQTGPAIQGQANNLNANLVQKLLGI
ncbi:MAG: flagellin FliC [Bdellovibrionales bacterium]|nr:flagellin FliC [Bdellovibrionales bacterium]